MWMNKKGDEKYLSPWNFVVWAFIGIAVVGGVLIFNASEIDIRTEEARLLSSRLSDCLVSDGLLLEDFFDDDFDIFEACSLSEDAIDKGILFYFNISILDMGSDEYIGESVIKGNRDLGLQYALETKFGECSERRVFAEHNGKDVLVIIEAGSNNLGGAV